MKLAHRRFLTFVGSVRGFLLTITLFVVLTYFATVRRVNRMTSTSSCPYGTLSSLSHTYNLY